MSKSAKAAWILPPALLILSAVPMLAGGMRLSQLFGGAEVTVENARFFNSPLPVIIHIFSIIVYCIFGAFQFSDGIRRRWPVWHRYVGWVLVVCGLLVAGSGLWMTLFYAWPAGDGSYLYLIRLCVGSAMIIFIFLGLWTAMKRDFISHRAWMIRAYALALGAGTQAITHLPWFILYGKPTELPRTILMGLGWLINILVAEWIIRRHNPKPL